MKSLQNILLITGLILALGGILSSDIESAQASYKTSDALGTIGVSTGIGAVIGLSTIAFYDRPTAHLGNTLVGAGAGLIVGIGVASYLLVNSSDQNEIDPEEIVVPPKNEKDLQKNPGNSKSSGNKKASRSQKLPVYASLDRLPLSSGLAMQRTALFDKKNWAVAFQVLELRF